MDNRPVSVSVSVPSIPGLAAARVRSRVRVRGGCAMTRLDSCSLSCIMKDSAVESSPTAPAATLRTRQAGFSEVAPRIASRASPGALPLPANAPGLSVSAENRSRIAYVRRNPVPRAVTHTRLRADAAARGGARALRRPSPPDNPMLQHMRNSEFDAAWGSGVRVRTTRGDTTRTPDGSAVSMFRARPD